MQAKVPVTRHCNLTIRRTYGKYGTSIKVSRCLLKVSFPIVHGPQKDKGQNSDVRQKMALLLKSRDDCLKYASASSMHGDDILKDAPKLLGAHPGIKVEAATGG